MMLRPSPTSPAAAVDRLRLVSRALGSVSPAAAAAAAAAAAGETAVPKLQMKEKKRIMIERAATTKLTPSTPYFKVRAFFCCWVLMPLFLSMQVKSEDVTQSTQGNLLELSVWNATNLRVFSLNRPQALNALNLPMVREMAYWLKIFEQPGNLSQMLVLEGVGGKAFCAGGDVVSIAAAVKDNKPEVAKSFFGEEYIVNYTLGTYTKPVVAIIDGIVSTNFFFFFLVNNTDVLNFNQKKWEVALGFPSMATTASPPRILFLLCLVSHCKEKTNTANCYCKETAIGLIPDVGGTFFLPRLDGSLGMYLALTGKRLKGVEVLYADPFECQELKNIKQTIQQTAKPASQLTLCPRRACPNSKNNLNRASSRPSPTSV